jgi:hypothetical protein
MEKLNSVCDTARGLIDALTASAPDVALHLTALEQHVREYEDARTP